MPHRLAVAGRPHGAGDPSDHVTIALRSRSTDFAGPALCFYRRAPSAGDCAATGVASEDAEDDNTIEAYRAVEEHFPNTYYATRARQKREALEAATEEDERRSRRQALAAQLGREFSPEIVGENGWTDLHYAAVLDLPELAEELIRQGLSPDAPLDGSGEAYGDTLKQRLRALGVADVDDWTSDGEAPLQFAALTDSLATAVQLVAQGADIHGKNDYGTTPLSVAAYGDALSIAEFLVAQGADIHAKSDNGITPLHSAASSP